MQDRDTWTLRPCPKVSEAGGAQSGLCANPEASPSKCRCEMGHWTSQRVRRAGLLKSPEIAGTCNMATQHGHICPICAISPGQPLEHSLKCQPILLICNIHPCLWGSWLPKTGDCAAGEAKIQVQNPQPGSVHAWKHGALPCLP